MAHRLQITLSALSFLYAGASGASAQSVALAAKTAAGTATAGPALRTADGHPDLQGYWTTATVTPLERPKDLGNKAFFTPEEAAAYAKKQLAIPEPTGKGTYADVHYNLSQFGLEKSQNKVAADVRTSLVFDPPDGRIPPMTPEARERNAERVAKNKGHEFDGPENRSLGERCILWPNEGPPMMPVGYNSNLQIVQGNGYVAILQEMIHDVRIVPTDGSPHLPSTHPAMDGRLARALGGGHPGGGYHEFHRQDGVSRLQRESARRRALPPRGRGHRPLSVYGGRSFHLDPLLERRDSHDQN